MVFVLCRKEPGERKGHGRGGPRKGRGMEGSRTGGQTEEPVMSEQRIGLHPRKCLGPSNRVETMAYRADIS